METEKTFDPKRFKHTIRAGITLVDFNAPWCAPCLAMKPVIEQLAEKFNGKAEVVELNVDENQQLAMGLDIMSIPTMIIFKQGEEVQRFVGLQSIEVLSEAVENAMV
jgi:thioredoxin 1